MFDGLDYVYEVYAEKSFSAAAKKLFISQPALSAAVKKAEKQLGAIIFDRSTNPISLTKEGRICIDSIERMRALERTMRGQLKDIADMKTGKIIVSGENFVSSFVLPEIIRCFMDKYPGIEVEIVESNTHDLYNRLLDERIDILIGHDFSNDSFVSYPLAEENLIIAVPAADAINEELKGAALSYEDIENSRHLKKDCPGVSIGRFRNESMIILKKGNDMTNRIKSLCAEANFEPQARIYPDQLLTAWNMTKAGLGATVVTDRLILSEGGAENCRFYRLCGKSTKRVLSVGCKKKSYTSRAVEAFMECAREVYAKK